MDVVKTIEELVEKFKSDETFKEALKKDPIKAIEAEIGVDLPDEQFKAIVAGVKEKLEGQEAKSVVENLEETAKDLVENLEHKLEGLFKK